MKKQFIAFLLSIAMVVSGITPVFAVDEPTQAEQEQTTEATQLTDENSGEEESNEKQAPSSDSAEEKEPEDSKEESTVEEKEVLVPRTFQAMFSTDDLIYGNDDGITRAEWLHNLVIMFDMSVSEDDMPDNYFSDLDSSSEY